MTERLYYTDAYRSAFHAQVVDTRDDGHRVYLDQTAFYPTSGGQPHDLGTLGGIAVTDVVDEDDRVAHVLASAWPAGTLDTDGTIDWQRRYDLMQQHTGQHLLSAMFEDQHGWATVSVHFGAESSTLDLAAPGFDVTMLEAFERAANALVVENRAIAVTFEDAATASGLRKASDRTGTLRVVSIDGLDRSACGGTHVRQTGEIGAILLRRAERMKGQMRIEFVCGQRAVTRARRDAEILARAAGVFTAAVDDLPRLVDAQQASLKEADRELRRLRGALADYEAVALWQNASVDAGGVRRVRVALDSGAVKEREALAQAIVARGNAMVLVTVASPPGLLLAASQDSGTDAGQTLKAALAAHGGRGGGSPRLAQGSVPDPASVEAIVTLLGFV